MADITMGANGLVPYVALDLRLLVFLIGWVVMLIDRVPSAAAASASP
jgi:hypothetical protein